MKISNIPEIQYTSLDKLKDDRLCLVVSSPSAWNSVKNNVNLNIKGDVLFPTSTNNEYLENIKESIIKNSQDVKVIYGIGGGQAIDISKFLAFHLNIPSFAIPTLLSTDAYLADYIAVRVNNCVTYPEVKRPDTVFIDYDFLSTLPNHFIAVGCGDTLAMATSLEDWKYADKMNRTTNDDTFSQANYDFSQSILEYLLAYEDEIKNKTKDGMQAIIQSLSMKVQLCSFLGHSRPEEGSEHFFVYNLENYTKHFLHGDGISLGVLLMLKLHGKDNTHIKKFSKAVGLAYDHFSSDEIEQTLKSLPNFCEEHQLPFSIVNDINLSSTDINSLLKDINK